MSDEPKFMCVHCGVEMLQNDCGNFISAEDASLGCDAGVHQVVDLSAAKFKIVSDEPVKHAAIKAFSVLIGQTEQRTIDDEAEAFSRWTSGAELRANARNN